jgi:hypothetical protein
VSDSSGAASARWTLGGIRARNMLLEAYCEAEGCNAFVSFDLDRLIEEAGVDFELPEAGPGIQCPRCGGGDMVFRLAYVHPDPIDQ